LIVCIFMRIELTQLRTRQSYLPLYRRGLCLPCTQSSIIDTCFPNFTLCVIAADFILGSDRST